MGQQKIMNFEELRFESLKLVIETRQEGKGKVAKERNLQL
jgi:hypothetical protein